jgi:hypothetical protein
MGRIGTAIARARGLGASVLLAVLWAGTASPPPAVAAVDLPETPIATWMPNGPVRAIARTGDVVWFGGEFTSLREHPPGRPGRVIPVHNLAALDVTTGQPVAGLDIPAVTGSRSIVLALAARHGTLYIGGRFEAVGGKARRNLAAIDGETGAVTRFQAGVNAPIWTLAAGASRLYLGGTFTTVKQKARNRLAAVAYDGSLDSTWTPSVDDRPRDMALAADRETLFVVGHFENATSPGGRFYPRDSVARFDVATGAVTPWIARCPCSRRVHALGIDVEGDRVYVGMGGADWVGAYDQRTGERVWRTDTNGQAQDVEVMGDLLLVAGHYRYVALAPGENTNCWTEPEKCARRQKLAALHLDGTLVRSWAPGMTGDYAGVWRVRAYGDRIWAGGEFTAVSGVPQQKIALFARSAG